jgi:translation elongation factor EF-Tu-like GTPase
MKTVPHRLYEVPDDFEAQIRIFTEAQGGRKTKPFNGIRWDFAYHGYDIQKDGIFMIWPDFHDTNNDSLPKDQPLPLDEILMARMTIVSDEMRDDIHKGRIEVGTRFYCHEGGKRVAEGLVTRVTGLQVPRQLRK